jgi:hypothetical protein
MNVSRTTAEFFRFGHTEGLYGVGEDAEVRLLKGGPFLGSIAPHRRRLHA